MSEQAADRARQVFAAHLRELHASVGRPPYRTLLKTMEGLVPQPLAVPRGTATISGWLNASFVRTPQWESVEAFCAGLRRPRPGGA